MNWEALGAISEIVGATAVVITLAYLAVQIRMARVTAAAEITYSTVEAYSRWRNSIMQNSDIAKAIAKVNRGETLDDEEHILLRTLVDDFFVTSMVSATSTDDWHSIQPQNADLEYVRIIFGENPGLAAYWPRFRSEVSMVSETYANAVDQILDELERAPRT